MISPQYQGPAVITINIITLSPPSFAELTSFFTLKNPSLNLTLMRVIVRDDKDKDDSRKWKSMADTVTTVVNSTITTTPPTISIAIIKTTTSASESHPKSEVTCSSSPAKNLLSDSTIKSLLLNKYLIPPTLPPLPPITTNISRPLTTSQCSGRSGNRGQQNHLISQQQSPQQGSVTYPLPPFKTLKKHLAGSTFTATKLADGSPHYEIDRTVSPHHHVQESMIIEEIINTFADRSPPSTWNRKARGKSKDYQTNSYLYRSNYYESGPLSILDYRRHQLDPQSDFSFRNYNLSNPNPSTQLYFPSYGRSFMSLPGTPMNHNNRIPTHGSAPPIGSHYGYLNNSSTPVISNRGVGGTLTYQFRCNPFSSSSLRPRLHVNDYSGLSSNKWQRYPPPRYDTFGQHDCCSAACFPQFRSDGIGSACGWPNCNETTDRCCCPMETECWSSNSSSTLSRSYSQESASSVPSTAITRSGSVLEPPPTFCYPCPCGCTQDVAIPSSSSSSYLVPQQQSRSSINPANSTIIGSDVGSMHEEEQDGIRIVYDNTTRVPFNGPSPWPDTTKSVSNWSKNVAFLSSDLPYDWRKMSFYTQGSTGISPQHQDHCRFQSYNQRLLHWPLQSHQTPLLSYSNESNYPHTPATSSYSRFGPPPQSLVPDNPCKPNDLWVNHKLPDTLTTISQSQQQESTPTLSITTTTPSTVTTTTDIVVTTSESTVTTTNSDATAVIEVIEEPISALDDTDDLQEIKSPQLIMDSNMEII